MNSDDLFYAFFLSTQIYYSTDMLAQIYIKEKIVRLQLVYTKMVIRDQSLIVRFGKAYLKNWEENYN